MTRSDIIPRPIPTALSPLDWVDALARDLLAAAVPELIRRLGESRPRCLFLGGSAALGEAIGWSSDRANPGGGAGPGRLLLSDLDLGLIVAEPPAAGERGRLPDLLRTLAEPVLARHGARYLSASGNGGPLTLGIYETRALAAQRPTLGLVDAASRGLALWGDPEGAQRFSLPSPAAIPRYEAWRLVGNRAVERLAAELASAPPAGGGRAGFAPSVLRLHARAKMATGLWTARLVLQGRYRIGWPARSAALAEAELERPDDALISCAVHFRPFLERGSAAGLPPETEQRRLLAAAFRQWLFESAQPESPAATSEESDRFPETGFLRERLTLRERVRLWREEEARFAPRSRWAATGRALRSALDPGAGPPEARRFAAAALFWRLAGAAGIREETEEAPWIREDSTAAALWEEGCRRFLGAPCDAGPGFARRLRERLDLGRGAAPRDD